MRLERNRPGYTIAGLLVAAIGLLAPVGACAQLMAGAARVDITPDPAAIKTPLGGYAGRYAKPATGIHDRVYARALALSNGDNGVVLTSLDLCFFPAAARAEVMKRVTAAAVPGLSAANVLISATHSHCGPDPLAMLPDNKLTFKGWTSYSPELTSFEADRIAQAILLAFKRKMPAKAGVASLDCTGMNHNRRGGKVVDPVMSLLRVTDDQGRSLASLVNFASHPTIYDEKMMDISADWPGVMCGWLEKKMGGDAVALFLNGAEGDASPDGTRGATEEAKAADYGTRLAAKAWDILQVMQLKTDVPVAVTRMEVTLPAHKPNALFVIAARTFGATTAQAIDLVNKIMPTATTAEFVRVGPMMMAALPCEPTGALGEQMKALIRKAGFEIPAIVALTDDWIAYALTPEQYKEGNYETGMSFFGDQLGPTLVKAVETGLLKASGK